MAVTNYDVIDSQILAENVSFLDSCFDKSFTVLGSSLNDVKSYMSNEDKSTRKNPYSSCKLNKSLQAVKTQSSNNANTTLSPYIAISNGEYKRELKNWGLPSEIVTKYESKGINRMFEWQVECLNNPRVLLECSNLIYSAPTSAGKTLVAEILTIKTILERQKKVIIILPFVSIVREKMFYLQNILSSSGIRVEGFMGSQSPPGGLQAVHVAICTIEKANSLVNKLLDENSISDLGAIIVDELHLLGDTHRGYILELLLTKVKYVCTKLDDVHIQIIGMSATLPNLDVLAKWLDAELFVTDFRPIPLDEYCLVGNKYYDKNGEYTDNVVQIENVDESDVVLGICLDTIRNNCSVLIFCMTKNRCENLAQSIASSFFKLGCSGNEIGNILREQLRTDIIAEVLEQLTNCPVGLDQVVKNTISFGVAYHHAGLTFDERDIIEGAFKSGAIRVLVATSTLSSGVNLPARKVIIRSPVFQRQPINIQTYKQMVGRAGRMGKDTKGESILICSQAEKNIGFSLIMGRLDPVRSCIETEDKFMRAVLEMIASQSVSTKSELLLYSKCSLLFAQEDCLSSQNNLLDKSLKDLINYELIRIQTIDEESHYVATSLGKACLSSSMAPNDGLSLFCELQKARQCIVLETELHLIYLVTPYSVSSQWVDIDWMHLFTLWESLTKAMKRVGELVGVKESIIVRCLRGSSKSVSQSTLNIHKRFYTALALQDLVNEIPLSEVSTKFQCARGFLQGLQQAAATFAGMVTAFCRQLGWKNMELLVSQFQDRLHFGVHCELLELMKLSTLNGVRARTLFDAGYETISSIASADVNEIENVLHKSVPFQSEKAREEDDIIDIRKRNKIRNIWITGYCGLTSQEAAQNLIKEARKYLQLEIGVTEIKWEEKKNDSKDIFRDNISQTLTNKDVIKTDQVKEEQTSFENDKIKRNTKHDDGGNTRNESKVNLNVLPKINNTQTTVNDVHIAVNIKKETVSNIDIKSNEDNNSVFDNLSNFKRKDDIFWDSLAINDTALNNISKLQERTIAIPLKAENIINECNDHSNELCNSKKSLKDISIFSSDGDNSSLFEDSLVIDSIPKTVVDNKEALAETTAISKYITNSILDVFKNTIIDEDEDFKLVYEDDHEVQKIIDKEIYEGKQIKLTHKNPQVNQETHSLIKDFVSPLKRTHNFDSTNQTAAKKKKSRNGLQLTKNTNFTLHCKDSKCFSMEIDKIMLECYILRENDIIDNLEKIFTIVETVCIIMIKNKQSVVSTDVIGSNLFKDKLSKTVKKCSYEPLNICGLVIYINSGLCIFLDLGTVKNRQFLDQALNKALLTSGLKIIMKSVKSNLLELQKWLNCHFSSAFFDVLVAEWLLHNEDGVTNIRELTKTYCKLDLLKAKITVSSSKKSYNSLDKFEESCLKAWCVFTIAKEQEKCLLEKYLCVQDIIQIENQVLKILSNSEYQGITVDKELASQLLLDCKRSQEILQRKAYKICGYHFNFNSSKDVAKASIHLDDLQRKIESIGSLGVCTNGAGLSHVVCSIYLVHKV
ncbi:unnamed protein product [Leptidea sinapis]|uniref:DNA polymerase theta n=1 Tax=Leptidea sinapis TaxID=189913 RepID=A0A5E4QIM4_9NEOP|nr:unnamed protein product [Leptidea sinapis]